VAQGREPYDGDLRNIVSLTSAIIITTRNRLEDLKTTVGTLDHLYPQPEEIFITADGCTDGTAEFVKTLPHIRLIVNDEPRGSVGSRDAMMRAASTDVVLSFDDDSFPVETDFVRRASGLFENNPRLAVATFPQHSDEYPETLTQTNFGESHFVGSYTSSGAAIRRSAYLELGGYATLFFHAYEEPDFSLRCIASSWLVRYETSLHVRHCYSGAQRNELRIHHFHARNELWSVMMRCPAPWLFAVGLFRLVRQLQYAQTRGFRWVLHEPSWWSGFFTGLPQCMALRQPVAWKQYRQWMELLRDPALSQADYRKSLGLHEQP